MYNPLDSITSSFITSAPSAVNHGGSKADAHQNGALDEQFSGLLNQAFHGQKPGTQHIDHTPAPKSHSVSQPKTKGQPEESTAAEQDTSSATGTTESKDTEETKETEPTEKSDKQNRTPSAEEVQALLQSLQPLDLTILKNTHLLGQNSMDATQSGEAGENDIAPVTSQTDAVGSANSGSLPSNAAKLSLLPGTGSQNMLAFALSGQISANGDGTSPTGTTEAPLPMEGLEKQLPASETTDAPPLPTPQATEAASTDGVNVIDTASQPALTAVAASSETGSAQLLGLKTEASRDTGNVGKPNASLPGTGLLNPGITNTETFRQTLDHLHSSLDQLNGEIEQVRGNSSEPGTDDAGTTEGPDTSTASTSDLLSALGGNNTNATAGAERANDGSAPIFSSLAANPTGQVAEATEYAVRNGQKELIIRLNPDNLGEVRVNLISHGNQELSARLIASTVESHDLLKSQLETLKSTLESQGVTVERLSVVLAGHTENSNGASSQQQSHTGKEQLADQQQQNTQQGSAFQQHNPQNPASNLFSQMGNQSQPGWAQRLNHATTAATPDTGIAEQATDGTPKTATTNDNGRISILA